MVYPIYNQTQYIYPLERSSFYLSTDFQDILLRNLAFQAQTPNIKIVNRLTDNMVTNIELLKCTIQCPSVVNCLDFTGNGEFNFISKDSNITTNVFSSISYDQVNKTFISYTQSLNTYSDKIVIFFV